MTSQSLGELVAVYQADGVGGLDRALGGAPALVLRDTAGGQVASTITTAEFSLSETHEGDALSAWAVASRTSEVVRVAKTERNPFSGLITVGRAANNDLCLASARISKLHAFIKQTPRGGGWLLQDNGSANGTFINTVRLEASRDYPLNSGDEVQFGDVWGTFLDGEGLQTLCVLVARNG